MGKPEPYPLVTVVIPTYNRTSLLRDAVQSALGQTEESLELIIVDDGSTDNTREMIASWNDSRIRYIQLEHTGHIGIVRNKGAFEAKGKWIAFLDSDDTWLPNKLQQQIATLQNSGRKWSYCGFRHVDTTGQTIPANAGTFRAVSGHITAELLKHEVAAIVCTLLVEKDLFLSSGGFSTDPRLTLRGDYEFVLRLSQLAEAEAIDEELVLVREHEGRVTRNVRDPFSRSMKPYIVFLETQQDPMLRDIARKQIHKLIREQQRKKENRFISAARSLSSMLTFIPFKTVKLP